MGTLNVDRNAPPPPDNSTLPGHSHRHTLPLRGETPRFHPQATAQAPVHCPEGPELTLPDLLDRRTAPC